MAQDSYWLGNDPARLTDEELLRIDMIPHLRQIQLAICGPDPDSEHSRCRKHPLHGIMDMVASRRAIADAQLRKVRQIQNLALDGPVWRPMV